MRLSILMLALEGRHSTPLQLHIKDQIQRVAPKDVELLVCSDNGELLSGIKRQRLVDQARGDYICFVDDDDWVSDNYVRLIYDQCLEVDVVTFRLKLTKRVGGYDQEQIGSEIWRFSLRSDKRRDGIMCANHLCAWRADLARKVGWCPFIGYGDDQLWYKPLMESGLVSTSNHLNEIVYFYEFDHRSTQNQTFARMQASHRYVGGGLKCFKGGSEGQDLFVEVGNLPAAPPRDHETFVSVVNSKGRIQNCVRAGMTEYATVRIQ